MRNKYLALECYGIALNKTSLSSTINNIRDNSSWLNKAFTSCSISIINVENTLVPSSVFQLSDIASFEKLNFLDGIDSRTEHSTIESLGIEIIFKVDNQTASDLQKAFPNAKFQSHKSALLSCLAQNFIHSQNETLYVNVNDNLFDLSVFDNRSLKFSNSYKFSSKEDFIYFLLFAAEQNSINPETIQLVLSGNLVQGSEVDSIVKKYFRHVDYITRPDIFEYSPKFQELPSHYFFTLFSQYLCV